MCLIESIYEQKEERERGRVKEEEKKKGKGRQRNEWWTFISLRNEQIEFVTSLYYSASEMSLIHSRFFSPS